MTRVREKIKKINKKNQNLPRLMVYRSNEHIYGQIIDDKNGKVLAAASSLKLKSDSNNIDKAFQVGKELASAAKKAKIKNIVFDRSGYKYHGRVKSLAEGARKAGLNF